LLFIGGDGLTDIATWKWHSCLRHLDRAPREAHPGKRLQTQLLSHSQTSPISIPTASEFRTQDFRQQLSANSSSCLPSSMARTFLCQILLPAISSPFCAWGVLKSNTQM
jgi:hypothetical protein